MKPLIPSALLGAALAVGAGAATTDPVGYYSKTLSGQFNFMSIGLANTVDFQGVVDSSYTATGAFVAGSFDQGDAVQPQYYLEIAEGENEGARIDIVSNTADTLTVDPEGSASFSALLDGSSVVIRKHITLNDVFGGDGTANPANLQIDPGADTGSADTVLVWNGNGFDTYFYDTFFLSPGWNGPDADGGRVVLAPGSGVIVSDNVNPGNVIVVDGAVKVTNTLIDLPVGFSLISSPVAIDRTLTQLLGGDGTAAPENLSIAEGADSGTADNVLTWNGSSYDTSFYDTFFLSPGWNSSDLTVDGSDAFFVEVKESNGATQVSIDLYDEDAGEGL